MLNNNIPLKLDKRKWNGTKTSFRTFELKYLRTNKALVACANKLSDRWTHRCQRGIIFCWPLITRINFCGKGDQWIFITTWCEQCSFPITRLFLMNIRKLSHSAATSSEGQIRRNKLLAQWPSIIKSCLTQKLLDKYQSDFIECEPQNITPNINCPPKNIISKGTLAGYAQQIR